MSRLITSWRNSTHQLFKIEVIRDTLSWPTQCQTMAGSDRSSNNRMLFCHLFQSLTGINNRYGTLVRSTCSIETKYMKTTLTICSSIGISRDWAMCRVLDWHQLLQMWRSLASCRLNTYLSMHKVLEDTNRFSITAIEGKRTWLQPRSLKAINRYLRWVGWATPHRERLLSGWLMFSASNMNWKLMRIPPKVAV